MKKKLILMCIAGALVMTAVIGGTLAGFNTSTESKGVTDIKVNTFSIDVSDAGTGENGQAGVMEFEEPAVPGKEIEINRVIKNTGSYDLFARVTVNKKWTDNLDAKMIELGMETDGWLVVNEDDEQIIMYRQAPIGVGEEVAVPVKSLSFDASMTNEYAGKSCEFDITVDAVQRTQGRFDGGVTLEPQRISGGLFLYMYKFAVPCAADHMAGRAGTAKKVGQLQRLVNHRLIVGMKGLHARGSTPELEGRTVNGFVLKDIHKPFAAGHFHDSFLLFYNDNP